MDSVFADRLATGERLLWTGRSVGGLLLVGRDAFLIPFSLLWGGFAIFWETMVLLGISRVRDLHGQAVHSQEIGTVAIVFPLFGLAFVLAGLFFIFGRFIVDAWLRGGMFYALTDRRVLILRTRPTRDFTAISLDRLPGLALSERGGGRGTVRFGMPVQGWPFRGVGFGGWMPALDPTPQFLYIDDARDVFAQIERAAGRGGR